MYVLFVFRTVSNNELNTIAMHCPDMEQLDILGTSEYNLADLKKYVLLYCNS